MDLETKDLKDMLHNSSVKAVHMLVTESVVFAFGLWIACACSSLHLSVGYPDYFPREAWVE